MRVFASLDAIHVGPAEDLAALACDRARQSREVFERMELGLIAICDARPGVEEIEGDSWQPFDRHAGPPDRGELVFQGLQLCSRRQEEIAVHALKVAIDLLGADDGLDAVDRGTVARRRKLGVRRPASSLHDHVTIVHRTAEVGRRATRDAAPERTIVEHYYVESSLR